MGLVVEAEVGAGERGPVAGRPGAAEHGLDAGDQLLEAERLDEVVVAPGEAPHGVLGAVAGGEEDDGGAPVLLAPAAADLEAVEVGQHDVEDDEVGVDLGDGGHGVPARGHGVDVEAGVAQRRFQHAAEVVLVVDQQEPFAAHGARMGGQPGSGLSPG